MLKKVIPIVLSLSLIFSISVMAENEGVINDGTTPELTQEMPMQGGQQGTPPQMPNGERPQGGNRMGQMPQGDFTPPQNNETNSAETPLQENNVPRNEGNQGVNTAPESAPENNSQNPNNAGGENAPQDRQFPEGMQGGFPGEMGNNIQNAQTEQQTGFVGFVKAYSTPITSVILLMLAFVFVFFYKRKNY